MKRKVNKHSGGRSTQRPNPKIISKLEKLENKLKTTGTEEHEHFDSFGCQANGQMVSVYSANPPFRHGHFLVLHADPKC